MKKTVALLTGFLLIIIALHAQQKQPRFLVEIGVGPSFPIGKFATRSYTGIGKEPAGLAKMGLGAQVTLGYYVNEVVGLMLSSGYSIYKQDASGYEDYMKSNLTNSSRVEVDTKSWKVGKIMAGCFYITPLTSAEEEITLITKLAAGVCKTDIPEYSWTAYGQNGTAMGGGTEYKTALPWSFCYQISATLRYKLNNNLHVLLDISSFNSTAQKVYTYNPFFPVPGPTYSEKRKFRLAAVNVMVGIGFTF